jgi:hypothetical protein
MLCRAAVLRSDLKERYLVSIHKWSFDALTVLGAMI